MIRLPEETSSQNNQISAFQPSNSPPEMIFFNENQCHWEWISREAEKRIWRYPVVQEAIIIGRVNPLSHPPESHQVLQGTLFTHFEGWRGASLLSPIEKVWSTPSTPASTPLPSHTDRKEAPMNDAQDPLHESKTRAVSESRTRRSRNKLTLLSARTVHEPMPNRQKKNGRHRWTEATRFKREETFHTHREDGTLLQSSNEKHEGIAQQVLIGWCVFLTLASMIAIIL